VENNIRKEAVADEENMLLSFVSSFRINIMCTRLSMFSSGNLMNRQSKTNLRPISLNHSKFILAKTRRLTRGIPGMNRLIVGIKMVFESVSQNVSLTSGYLAAFFLSCGRGP
jgi:hypothetical protein